MTAILDRIQRIVKNLNKNDQYKDIISNFSDDDLFAFKIFLENSKNLKFFTAGRKDLDDELNYWLVPLGVYLILPEDLRKKESKENIKKRGKEYVSTLETYNKVTARPFTPKVYGSKEGIINKVVGNTKNIK